LSSDLLPAGDIFVEASYNLGLCKENSNPVTIEQMPAFSIVENHVAPSCYGESDAIINVVVNGGSPFLNNVQISDYNFEWFPLSLNGQGVNQTNGQLVFSIPNMGSGSHFLKVVDRYGCDTVFNVVVPETEPLSANIDLNNLSCNIINEPNTDGELQVNVVGGTFPYVNFMLIQANDTLSINNTGLFENLESGTYSISFEDIRGCGFMENNIILSQPPVMDIDIQSFSNVLCNGENTAEIQVSSTGGTQPYVNFSISGTSVSSSSGLFEDLGVGVYTILVEDQNGCNDSVSQTINEPSELLEPTFNVTDVSCFNDFDGQILTDVSGGTPPYLFSWSNGENEEDIDKLFSGNYTVTITDDNGCQQSGTTFVDQPDQVIADWLINTPIDMSTQLIMSQPIPYTVSFTDTSLNHDPLLTEWWIDGENRTNEFYGFDQYVDFTFREIGEYDITMYAYNMNGCFDTISTNVTVQGISHINAFSPNSDNINDFFYFENYGITDLNAVLYNRWGDKIYEMDSPDDVWNGVSLNGLEAPEGVYFYVLNATGQDGTDYKQKGSVTLFK